MWKQARWKVAGRNSYNVSRRGRRMRTTRRRRTSRVRKKAKCKGEKKEKLSKNKSNMKDVHQERPEIQDSQPKQKSQNTTLLTCHSGHGASIVCGAKRVITSTDIGGMGTRMEMQW
jgi:hypothetical protein